MPKTTTNWKRKQEKLTPGRICSLAPARKGAPRVRIRIVKADEDCEIRHKWNPQTGRRERKVVTFTRDERRRKSRAKDPAPHAIIEQWHESGTWGAPTSVSLGLIQYAEGDATVEEAEHAARQIKQDAKAGYRDAANAAAELVGMLIGEHVDRNWNDRKAEITMTPAQVNALVALVPANTKADAMLKGGQ